MQGMHIIIAGIIVSLVWLGLCILIEEKRNYVLWAGVAIDAALFLICRNCDLLLCGLAGGFLCGLGCMKPGKYKTAVREFKGVRGWMTAAMIFFVMIFLSIGVAYPDLKIVLG